MDARRRVPDYVAAGILVVLAAIVLWESTRWPAAGGFAGNPTLVPHALAVLMVATALGLALLLRRLGGRDATASQMEGA